MARLTASLVLRGVGLIVDVVLLSVDARLAGLAGILVLAVLIVGLRIVEGWVVRRARSRLISAHEVELGAHARTRVEVILRGLAARAGRQLPHLAVVSAIGGDRFNAAAAPAPQGGVLLVTPGALDSLTDSELEAVMCHELSHLWRQQPLATVALTLFGSLLGSVAYQVGLALSLWGTSFQPGGRVESWPGLIAVVVAIPWITRLFARIPARREEYRADQMAIVLGADPASLAIAVYELEMSGLSAWRHDHHLPALHPDDVAAARAHFTSQQRRVLLEALCHPHSSLLRTLLVLVAAGAEHPSLARRARRMLHHLDRPMLLPAPFGVSQPPATPRPPGSALGAAP